MKIAIGNDHAASQLKMTVCNFLKEKGIEYIDVGVAEGEKADYPNIAEQVCKFVVEKQADFGILICGTGVGMSMAANKVKGIRAACCSDYFSAKYTRLHNDANVLCFGQRVVGEGLAVELVDVFLNTPFEGGRHQRRIDIITEIENKQK